MQVAVVVLVLLAALDLVAVGFLLTLAWVVHRRQRRVAVATGAAVPPAATGQFAFLAAFGLLGLAILTAAAVILLDE